MQRHFKNNGYTTNGGGKILHSGFKGKLPEDFDQVLSNGKGGPKPKKQMNWSGKAWDWGAFPEKDEQIYNYQLSVKAAEVLRQEHDNPFFLTAGIFRPHVPMFVPQNGLIYTINKK